ncbi:hypothetical protein [Antarcticimicrobium sediminis]|uniref:Uncharacterized protein n=1 Tax=Antarcticimicrobium sediminis TaxID=2546227 RepID=A0A4R5EZB3_9RHOB|nr:hypothetical protein [Antarcticimicrobium sediminis]TDE40312.1 hypothetical protein E1B25_05010 [Antarcticimicrobium sediminis]
MILITPEERNSDAAALLQSLKRSVQELRQIAEALKQEIETEGGAGEAVRSKDLERAGQVIRSCQKVEECFVQEQHRKTGIAQGGYALDLDAARAEVGCRLGRLRACCDPGEVS